ncbi:MAG: O-antigen export system, permease protein, partial [uncultured Phycisphaerae bacterium]
VILREQHPGSAGRPARRRPAAVAEPPARPGRRRRGRRRGGRRDGDRAEEGVDRAELARAVPQPRAAVLPRLAGHQGPVQAGDARHPLGRAGPADPGDDLLDHLRVRAEPGQPAVAAGRPRVPGVHLRRHARVAGDQPVAERRRAVAGQPAAPADQDLLPPAVRPDVGRRRGP